MENNKDIIKFAQGYQAYAESRGFKLNPKEEVVAGIIKGLLKNEEKHGKKYCPCRRVTGDLAQDVKIICPCAFHIEELARDGQCLCGLFVKEQV